MDNKKREQNHTNIFYLLRIARNKKVKELAEDLRVTSAYINAIEKGKRTPSIRLIKDYAEVLDIDERIIHSFIDKNERFENMLLSLLKVICK